MSFCIGLLLFLKLLLLTPSGLSGMEPQEILAELKTNEWESSLLNDMTIYYFKNKGNFDNLINVVDDREVNWRIKIRGIRLIGEIRTQEAASNLVRMFNDESFHNGCPSLKLYLASALGNYKTDMTALLALIDGLKDDELLAREESAKSLGRIGNPMAVPYLAEALKDRSFAVKINAVKALKAIGDINAYPYLKQITDEKHEDPLLRKAAASAIETLIAKKGSVQLLIHPSVISQ